MGGGNEIHKAKIMLATDALIHRGERGSINSYSRWPREMTWRLLSSGKEAPRNPEFMFRSGVKTTSGCRCVNKGWPWTSSCSPCTEMLPPAVAAVAAPTVVVVAIIISLFSAPVLLVHRIGFWTLYEASDPKKGITNRRQFAPEFQQLPPLHKSRREAEEVDHCLRHGRETSNSFADSRVPAAVAKTLSRECMDSFFLQGFLSLLFFLSSSLLMPIIHNKKVFEELGSAVSKGNFATHDLWLRNYRCTWKWRWQSDPHARRLRQACGRRPCAPRAHVPGCTHAFLWTGGGPKAACRPQPFLPIVSSLYIFCASCPFPLPLSAPKSYMVYQKFHSLPVKLKQK